ncbi:MAG: ABC transporter permease [Planctomycetota bacterium]
MKAQQPELHDRKRSVSLWRDAFDRLRRNRWAWWSFLFVVGFAGLSFLAPVLPLPSPIALQLAREPSPPIPPWRHLGDLGWQYRTVFTLVTPSGQQLAGPDQSALTKVIRASLGREPTWLAEEKTATGATELSFAIPLLVDDFETRKNHLAAEIRSTFPGLELGEIRSENEYWSLNSLDRSLLSLRGSIFGLWQTGHYLGTDAKGRDLLARILWGSRTSFLAALAATLCSLCIGVSYGAVAGLVGGWCDNLLMRIVDGLYSIPFIFVVIFLVTIVNSHRIALEEQYGIDREVILYFVIGGFFWLTMARVVRGQVLTLKHREFMEATRGLGASSTRLFFAHLLPNLLPIVIVYLTLTIPAVMLFEAFLSFLGLGIEAPKVSWGLLAVDSMEAVSPLRTYWWLVVGPAAAMASTLLALNILGDGLRDALDPRLRGRE